MLAFHGSLLGALRPCESLLAWVQELSHPAVQVHDKALACCSSLYEKSTAVMSLCQQQVKPPRMFTARLLSL